MNELNKCWKQLNGDNIVKRWESSWNQWNAHHTTNWLKYVIYKQKYNNSMSNDSSSNDDRESSSDPDQPSSADKTESWGMVGVETSDEKSGESSDSASDCAAEIGEDFLSIAQCMTNAKLGAKQTFPMIKKSIDLVAYGFKFETNRQLICKAIRRLMSQYQCSMKTVHQDHNNKQPVPSQQSKTTCCMK